MKAPVGSHPQDKPLRCRSYRGSRPASNEALWPTRWSHCYRFPLLRLHRKWFARVARSVGRGLTLCGRSMGRLAIVFWAPESLPRVPLNLPEQILPLDWSNRSGSKIESADLFFSIWAVWKAYQLPLSGNVGESFGVECRHDFAIRFLFSNEYCEDVFYFFFFLEWVL
jgi:hypothetical protein